MFSLVDLAIMDLIKLEEEEIDDEMDEEEVEGPKIEEEIEAEATVKRRLSSASSGTGVLKTQILFGRSPRQPCMLFQVPTRPARASTSATSATPSS